MSHRILQALILVAALGVGTAALARTFHTPPMGRSPDLANGALCLVANTRPDAIGPFTIRIYRSSGTIANSAIVDSLNAKATFGLRATHPNLGPSVGVFCEVEGTGLSRRRTPATLCVVEAGSDTCLGSVIVP